MEFEFEYESVIVRKRSKLPHWDVRNGIYSVTLRVADSLPDHVLIQLEEQRCALLTMLRKRGDIGPKELSFVQSVMRNQTEEYLDAGWGECPFLKHDIASVVARALQYFDGQRYELCAWCVMPNHVHVVFELKPPHTLAGVMHSWKSYTSKEINRILGRDGTFWQDDYFDRTIRNGRHLGNAIDYVRRNPAKAGLRDWPWVYVSDHAV